MQVKNFRGQLRDCLSTGLKREDEHSRKALYFKIRDLVERFKNDPEWTAHVADTRRWLDFGIPEKRRSDGAHVNYFESSIGKSTGQKAKLAFTILAASLLAQYGLADDPDRANSLRLVAVDEVFAHTDEPNSRRALDLFKSMGFQLIVIVPWEAKARVARGMWTASILRSIRTATLRTPDCDSRALRHCSPAECERGVNYSRRRSALGRAFCACRYRRTFFPLAVRIGKTRLADDYAVRKAELKAFIAMP